MVQIGDRIERWEIVRRLGAGGQADVYEARHVELGGRAAIKVLSGHGSPERLLTEGRLQAQIHHPNICRVLDVLRVGDVPMLVMAYIDGPNLAEWLRERPRAWPELAPILAGVLDGVAAAHAHGVVHRDLKPSNIVLAPSPAGAVPVVVDFGIARDDTSATQTRSGVALGTLRYMAPEQLRHAAGVDARADVWALGALIYEAVTGRPAFDSADPIAQHAAYVDRAYVDPTSLAPALPEAVARAIRGALEPTLERRIPDVATLRAVLAGDAWDAPADAVTWEPEAAPDSGPRTPAVEGFTMGARLDGDAARERWSARADAGGAAVVTIAARGDAATRLARERDVTLSLPRAVRVARVVGHGTLSDGRPWLARTVPDGPTVEAWAATRRTRDEIHAVIAGALETAAALHALSPPVWVRDWSPKRLVVGADGPWLAELGLVRDRPLDPLLGGHTFEGELGYLAPEQLHGDSGPGTDVWAIAALAAGLFTRTDPRVLRRGPKVDYADRADLPASWREVLDAMLAEDPAARPSAAVALARWRRLSARPVEPDETPAPSPRGLRERPAAAARPGFATAPPAAEPEDFHQPPARPDATALAPAARRTPWALALGVVAILVPLMILPIVSVIGQEAPAPVAAPTRGDTPALRTQWHGDGSLTVTPRGQIVGFDRLPLSQEREMPLVGTLPTFPQGSDPQRCSATLAIDEAGVVFGVRVTGCSRDAAEHTANALITWKFAPTGALRARRHEAVYSLHNR